jgi:diguanylate cyclase (GGDEF)-like protein
MAQRVDMEVGGESCTRLRAAGFETDMRHPAQADPADGGTPVSVEAAFRRVRLLVGALVLVRLWTNTSIPHVAAALLVGTFWSINLVAYRSERHDARTRMLLGVLQMLADTLVILLMVWAMQHGHMSADSADWAVLVLPAIEGAIRFGIGGALAGWVVVAGGYWAANVAATPALEPSRIAQRLTVVLLVALPVGYLADQLVAEIDAHRRGRAQAEQRTSLLRIAARAGRRASLLDVDEILAVINETVIEMGFTDPIVFELRGRPFDDPATYNARPLRGSHADVDVTEGHERIVAAAAVRARGGLVVRRSSTTSEATLIALAIPMPDDQFVALTAFWPAVASFPDGPLESLELFVAQAGASVHNARHHRALERLKDRLDHEASHDSLTSLANRRRFTEELERVSARGRPGDLVGVLFCDLDGFKDVNDHYGHDAGNELLVEVANRFRASVRPGDLVARIGGDEFVVMLTRLESPAPAAAVAERICAVLREPIILGLEEICISTSLGIALAPAANADTAALVRRADAAMYEAKSEGKARWAMDSNSLQSVAPSERAG